MELTFPWWCLFIAYGFCVILVSMSILFIIARGIEFGDLKSQQWLTSIVTGFFSSVLITQPMKVTEYCISLIDQWNNLHCFEDHLFVDVLCILLSER